MNKRIAALVFALVLLTVFATSFAFINANTIVRVWPLTSNHSMTLVIAVSLAAGAGVGGLLVSLFQHRGAMPSVSKVIVATNATPISGKRVRK
jgi:hypothetical protein